MKKFLVLISMIACIFGMTACGSEKEYTQYEQKKISNATVMVEKVYVPFIQAVLAEESMGVDWLDDYTAEEIEVLVSENLAQFTYYNYQQGMDLEVDGYAFASALESFDKANKEIGGPGVITGSDAVIDGKQIIVTVYVQGTELDATAEVVVSNDMFCRLESASLNKVNTMSDSMTKAALNTLLGMGSVFVVLILISLIISCFAIIPKLQNAFAKKEKKETASTAGINNAVAQISEQEENEADDLELVAVIAAAIAASEGQTSTDGFVVRSIKRRY